MPSATTARCAWATKYSLRNPTCSGRSLCWRAWVHMPEVEIALHVLFVAFLAIRRSRHRWDVVTTYLKDAA